MKPAGTDIHHQDLDLQKKFDGESFYKYKERSGARMAPWWHSESGYVIIMDLWGFCVLLNSVNRMLTGLQTRNAHGTSHRRHLPFCYHSCYQAAHSM